MDVVSHALVHMEHQLHLRTVCRVAQFPAHLHIQKSVRPVILFQLEHIIVGHGRVVFAAEGSQNRLARLHMCLQHRPSDEGLPFKGYPVHSHNRAFGDIEDYFRVSGFMTLQQLATGERTTHFLVSPHDRLTRQFVGHRAQRFAPADHGQCVQFFIFKVLGPTVLHRLHN